MNVHITLPSTFPVTAHTDFVQQGCVFVAIEGYSDNGINYIKKAVEKGAKTIVIQQNVHLDNALSAYIEQHAVIVLKVANTRQALAQLSAEYAHFPAQKLRIIGVTGTKGKTTTSFILEHVLRAAGYKTALISSAKNKILGAEFPAPLTTPQPDYLQQFLKICADQTVDYVVMEVAAQALSLHRVEGIAFCGLIFTNFSHEHLEFYPTMDDYFAAKYSIFAMAQENAPILINADDMQGRSLLCGDTAESKELLAGCSNVIAYGFDADVAHYKGIYQSAPLAGITIAIPSLLRNDKNLFICPILFGAYNGYNVLAACGMALEIGISSEKICKGLLSFAGVPGRLQHYLLPNGARSFIDYAHNPDSFRALLSTLRLLTDNLIVLFGAGGGRDKSKRPLMGLIAIQLADKVIISSDNPRFEDPLVIADDIIKGIPDHLSHKIVCQLDRKEAIELAYSLSSKGAIIALLGKGPDEYQIIGTTKYYFSEQQILQQL